MSRHSSAWIKSRFKEYTEAIWARGELDRIPEFVHPDCVYNDVVNPAMQSRGHEPLREAVKMYRTSFGNLRGDEWYLVAEDDVLMGCRPMQADLIGPDFPPEQQGQTIKVWVAGMLKWEGGLMISSYNFFSIHQPGLKLLKPLKR